MSAGQSAPPSPPLRVYRRSPVRRLVLAAACLTLAAIAGSALLREGPAGAAAVLGFALLGASWCAGSAWWTWRYSTDALRLDPEGFTLVKGGDHRLSREEDLRRLTAALDRVLEQVGAAN